MISESEHTDAPGRGGTRIQSVARACQLLLWLADKRYGATAKEIAFAHRLTLPTTYHLLNTLVDQGLLAKDEERRFVLGRSSAIVAEAYLRASSVPETLLAAIRELAEQTHEVVSLADWCDEEIRILASVEGTNVLRVAQMMNAPYEDAHARANGKLLLAYAWPQSRRAVLSAAIRHGAAHQPRSVTCDNSKPSSSGSGSGSAVRRRRIRGGTVVRCRALSTTGRSSLASPCRRPPTGSRRAATS